jgi:hypothetical protein
MELDLISEHLKKNCFDESRDRQVIIMDSVHRRKQGCSETTGEANADGPEGCFFLFHQINPLASWVRALFLSSCLMSCASPLPPPAPEVTVFDPAQRLAAAEYALQQNIRLQAIVDACTKVSDEAQAQALETQKNWWYRNWPMVAAADAEFEVHSREYQSRLGEITGQLYALRFDLEARTQANETIETNVRRSTRRDRTCLYYLDLYDVGQLDLSNNEQHHPVLNQMQAEDLRAANSRPRRAPHIHYGFIPQKNAGRSLALVEKFVRNEFCVGAQIINIFEQWPRELYGVFCPDVDPIALECEWGRCERLSEK